MLAGNATKSARRGNPVLCSNKKRTLFLEASVFFIKNP